MKSYQAILASAAVIGLASGLFAYGLPTYFKRKQCKATFAIEPINVGHARVSSDDRGTYWAIDLHHVGAHSTPVYWHGQSYPPLRDKRSVYKLAPGTHLQIRSEHAGPGARMHMRSSQAFSYLSDAVKSFSTPAQLLYPFDGVDLHTIMQSGEGNDGRTLRHDDAYKFAVDVKASIGTEVLAGTDGVVAFTEGRYPDSECADPKASSRGNVVTIRSLGGFDVKYGHLQHGSITVSPGDSVRRGQIIGRVGASGAASIHHLHMHAGGITNDGYTTIPIELIDSNGAPVDLAPGSKYGTAKTGD